MQNNYLSYDPIELGFGTSGLRGLVSDMKDLECYVNVAGFLSYLQEIDQLKGQVYVAGDLRSSTPRILQAVATAIRDSEQVTINCGFIPTPAVAFWAQLKSSPCIMVTGSHIPDDRNGIKFYKTDGEVLKTDEQDIQRHVASVRSNIYATLSEKFTADGALKETTQLPEIDIQAEDAYKQRYLKVFPEDMLRGKQVIMYQHSAVGRDIITEVLEHLGAEVHSVGRSDVFIPIDTENVTLRDQAYFKELASTYPDAFAIVSTDGDSDRPFVIDETGVFHRGDVLGAVVASVLRADFVAYPVSSSDALDMYFDKRNVEYKHTKIGSPYVIDEMNSATSQGKVRVVGWEVNGGFLLNQDITLNDKELKKLPTRDALLPILVALQCAVSDNRAVSEIFEELSTRYTQAGMIDNFPADTSKRLMQRYAVDSPQSRAELHQYFSTELGFGDVKKVVSLDGIRIYFRNGDIAHMRPSGNAPQLRIYSVADSQERSDQIVAYALSEPNGIFRNLEKELN